MTSRDDRAARFLSVFPMPAQPLHDSSKKLVIHRSFASSSARGMQYRIRQFKGACDDQDSNFRCTRQERPGLGVKTRWLWEFVLPCCAQSCQLQRMPRELEIDGTNKIIYLQISKIPNQLYVSPSTPTTNQVVGSSNLSGRANFSYRDNVLARVSCSTRHRREACRAIPNRRDAVRPAPAISSPMLRAAGAQRCVRNRE